MKRLFILAFLIAFSSFSYSQDLVIRNFILDEKDLSGSTYARTDNNGNFCSLIIVRSNLQGCDMTFLGNVVGKVEERYGDFWVYVTPGTKKLRIKCPNYITVDLDINQFDIEKTESKKTYILTVLGQNSITPTAETRMQGLTIRYSPIDAIIKINHEDMEASNGIFKTKYPIGKYTYEVSSPGYLTKSDVLELSSTNPTEISVTLQTMTEIQEVQKKQAEDLYMQCKSLLRIGEDEDAEKLAIKVVNLGSDSGYEIITALQFIGFYDDGRKIPVDENLLNQWQMKQYHIAGKELLERRH